MVEVPIYVPRKNYRGSDPLRRKKVQQHNDVARRLEELINRLVAEQEEPICSYSHFDMARRLGEDPKLVARIGFGIDAGHNGFTAIKPDLSKAELDRAMGRSAKSG